MLGSTVFDDHSQNVGGKGVIYNGGWKTEKNNLQKNLVKGENSWLPKNAKVIFVVYPLSDIHHSK